MPESVTDRCTKAHEYIFLLSKSAKYFYDADAIKEPAKGWKGSRFEDGKNLINHPNVGKKRKPAGWDTGLGSHGTIHRDGRAQAVEYTNGVCENRNKRSVWTIPTQPFPEAHFATFPPQLIQPCILAGCPEGGTVFDPFFGAGTTGYVCEKFNRKWVGIELNPEYAEIAKSRIERETRQLKMF
jgi:site-specific DNA-methyltransferase (cytosine-N4-specific)